MKISLEFCGAPNCSINQFGTAYDVVKAVDRDNVGVTVDTFHFHEMCSRLEDLRAADGKKIFAYHLMTVRIFRLAPAETTRDCGRVRVL